jgi:hypothetical protein
MQTSSAVDFRVRLFTHNETRIVAEAVARRHANVPQVLLRQANSLLDRAAKKIKRIVDITQTDVLDSQPDESVPVAPPVIPAPETASPQTETCDEPRLPAVFVLGPPIATLVIDGAVHHNTLAYEARADREANFAAQVLTVLCETEDQIAHVGANLFHLNTLTFDEFSRFNVIRARYYPEIDTDPALIDGELEWLQTHRDNDDTLFFCEEKSLHYRVCSALIYIFGSYKRTLADNETCMALTRVVHDSTLRVARTLLCTRDI